MTLTLRLRDVGHLDNGSPVEFVLFRRGAIVGRSPTCDWSLPDPRNHVSSRHCEVRYEKGEYVLVDTSTNGTFLNESPERMTGPHRLADGDRLGIGPYVVEARLAGAAAQAASPAQTGAGSFAQGGADPDWGGWEAHGGAPPPPPPPPDPHGWGSLDSNDGWGAAAAPAATPAPPPPPPDDGWGVLPANRGSDAWAAPSTPAAVPAVPVQSPWAQPEIARPEASAWSSAAPDRAPAPRPDDIWGRIAEGHVVDWARGGFGHDEPGGHSGLGLGGVSPGAAPAAPAQTPRDVGGWATPGLPAVAVPDAPPAGNGGWGPSTAPAAPAAATWSDPVAPAAADWGVPAAPPPAAAPLPPPPAAAPGVMGNALLDAFLRGANLPPAAVKAPPAQVLEQAGDLLRRLVSGLVVLVEARARAKSQMGAEVTSFGFDGNNPLKFARSPEQALEQLVNPAQRGFMDAPTAVADAYGDLQSHQMATLKAMQGALRATLDRFSPAAIRGRAEAGGLLSRILPGAREAALWAAYEREYGGVKQGSDEAFMDVFAREFRRAYEEQARGARGSRA